MEMPTGLGDAEKLQLAKTALGSCDNARRFALELEFVQCLANPNYINWLAQHRYLDDPAFVRFLGYLQYWKQPEYAQFLTYPHALYFLDMLQDQRFRQSMASTTVKELVHTQQFRHWQHYRRNRMQEAASGAAARGVGGGAVGAAVGSGAATAGADMVDVKKEQG